MTETRQKQHDDSDSEEEEEEEEKIPTVDIDPSTLTPLSPEVISKQVTCIVAYNSETLAHLSDRRLSI